MRPDDLTPITDQRVYRWVPEIDAIRSGMIRTAQQIEEDGDPDLRFVLNTAITHLDRALKALEWHEYREIDLNDLARRRP